MNYITLVKGNRSANVGNVISLLFGIVVLAIGIINTFWGHDAFFGIFLVSLSPIYFLPVNDILTKTIGLSVPKIGVLKIVLGILILWAAAGVGELFEKIDIMLML